MSDRRGRRHTRHDDRAYYDNDDDYDYDYEHRPRHRSLGRQALDKISDAIGSLGLDDSSHRSRSTSRRRPHNHRHYSRSSSREYDYDRDRDRAVERYYPPSASSTRRHHSSSPHHARSRRSRRDSASRPRVSSRSRSRLERGIEAAMEAGAAEAFRLRKEPGGWGGAKGGRVATAALSAGVIGAATEKRKQESGGGKLGTLGSAVGGLVVNRLVNGPRKEVRR